MSSLKRPFIVSVLIGVFLGLFLNSSWAQPPPKRPPLKPKLKPHIKKPLVLPKTHIEKIPEKTIVVPETTIVTPPKITVVTPPEKTVVVPETIIVAPVAIPDLAISGFSKVESENPWMLERGFVAPGDRVVFRAVVINQGNATYKGPIYAYATSLPEGWQMEGPIEEVSLSPYNTEAYKQVVKVSVAVPNNAIPRLYSLALKVDPVPGEKVVGNNSYTVIMEVLAR